MKKRAISEAWGILLALGALLLLSLAFLPALAVLWFALMGFTLYFFRDPEREIPPDSDVAVAPADGSVVEIEVVEEPDCLKRRMMRVSIFLSVLDVHVNRSPISGRIVHSKERKGKYLDARNPESSKKNASRLWVIEGASATVAVRQITGAIARRIVAWSRVGDALERGEKFGMIRFGSRTELYLPEGAEVLVRVGESVRAGETVVARLPAVVDREAKKSRVAPMPGS